MKPTFEEHKKLMKRVIMAELKRCKPDSPLYAYSYECLLFLKDATTPKNLRDVTENAWNVKVGNLNLCREIIEQETYALLHPPKLPVKKGKK